MPISPCRETPHPCPLPQGGEGVGRASRAQAFPRPQAHPAGVVVSEGQRSAARRWLVIRFRELQKRRGWIEPPSARPVALRQRRFESSGPRFCRAGVDRRGLASSSRRGRSTPRRQACAVCETQSGRRRRRRRLWSVPEASREPGATLARRRRTHPAKRHASGWPPLGDGMAGSIREVGRAGISYPHFPALTLPRHGRACPDHPRLCIRATGHRAGQHAISVARRGWSPQGRP